MGIFLLPMTLSGTYVNVVTVIHISCARFFFCNIFSGHCSGWSFDTARSCQLILETFDVYLQKTDFFCALNHWDAAEKSHVIYYCKVATSSFSETKRLFCRGAAPAEMQVIMHLLATFCGLTVLFLAISWFVSPFWIISYVWKKWMCQNVVKNTKIWLFTQLCNYSEKDMIPLGIEKSFFKCIF